MIGPAVAKALADVVSEAELSILSRIADGRGRQEPDLTSRLMENIEIRSEAVDGVAISLQTIDGLGSGAAESVIGADVLGAINIDIGGVRVSKGFLVQAKMSGKDNLKFRPPGALSGEPLDASHVFARGPISRAGLGPSYEMGLVSGTVTLTRPSARLAKQCDDMLRLTPAAFVLVFDRKQIAMVSAAAVRAHRHDESGVRHDLGTKTLTDFFVNTADCFIGDERLGSATQGELLARASLFNVSTVVSLSVTDSRGR